MNEVFIQCPYCWQNISVLVDSSVSEQSYIEDCEVCCRPMQISVSIAGEDEPQVSAESIEQ